jgi:thiamine-monophosphate kinase
MKLKDLGEFGFIDKIKLNALIRKYQGLVGIGDDCALFKVTEGMSVLMTTDMLVERVHFLRDIMTPYQIGYKSLAVNLSDIAASGGIPKEAFISIAVPEDVSVEDLMEIYRGMKELASGFDVNITGGDTTGSLQDLIINIAVTGEVEADLVLYRSGAKEGDLICVTGCLGDSGAGLDIILHRRDEMSNFPHLINQHFMPLPHIEQGRIIAQSRLAHAMMDISDGLASDIRHICNASELGAVIYENQLPLSENFMKYVTQFKKDLLKTAIGIGEDYNLLLTVPPGNFDALKKALNDQGHKLYNVGQMTRQREVTIVGKEGNKEILQLGGWDHFKEKNL